MTAELTFDAVYAELEASVEEVAAENPDVGPDDVWHDLVINKFHDHEVPMAVRADLARCVLGWDPEDDADLYRQYGISTAEAGR